MKTNWRLKRKRQFNKFLFLFCFLFFCKHPPIKNTAAFEDAAVFFVERLNVSIFHKSVTKPLKTHSRHSCADLRFTTIRIWRRSITQQPPNARPSQNSPNRPQAFSMPHIPQPKSVHKKRLRLSRSCVSMRWGLRCAAG